MKDLSNDDPVPVHDPRSYPQPRAPISPVLSFGLCAGFNGKTLPSILDAGQSLLVTSGRVAIALALENIGVKPNHRILVPAYNCEAMLQPVIWSGATPVTYKVNPDLSIDLEDIESKVDVDTTVLIIVHYFGFPQDIRRIRTFCDKHSLMLIEDCAHSFFGQCGGLATGSYGDYAIASLMKFFPVYDGGCLVSAKRRMDQQVLIHGGYKFGLKGFFNALEKSIAYSRLRPLNWLLGLPLKVTSLGWNRLKSQSGSSDQSEIGPGSSDGGVDFDPKWLRVRMSWPSRFVFRRTSIARLIGARRKNYQYLLKTLSGLPQCRPLFPDLPDSVVPYVFPLYVEFPERVFSCPDVKWSPHISVGEYF